MKIACLQFAPAVGEVDNNVAQANEVLRKADPKGLDLLVLPELAFSGYNFKSLQHITPYLEPTKSGVSSLWARATARRLGCVVTVGYPENVDISSKWPADPEYYNSTVTVNSKGRAVAHYRKTHLYYTDETWALEGPDGFYDGDIEGLGAVAMGICMDLNPYKFEAPWSDCEFAYHIIHRQTNLVILSMAWLTRENATYVLRLPSDPDMQTLSYWIARLEPLIRAEDKGEIIVVFANRCGVEGDAVYAGTSAILGIEAGEVKVYGILGRGEIGLLVVDTTQPPQARLVAVAKSAESFDSGQGHADTTDSTIDPTSLGDVHASPIKELTGEDSIATSNGNSGGLPIISNIPETFSENLPSRTASAAFLDHGVAAEDSGLNPGLEEIRRSQRPRSSIWEARRRGVKSDWLSYSEVTLM